jgi:hypothetical protein
VAALAAEVVVSEADSEDSAAAAVAEEAEGRGGEEDSKCEVESTKFKGQKCCARSGEK